MEVFQERGEGFPEALTQFLGNAQFTNQLSLRRFFKQLAGFLVFLCYTLVIPKIDCRNIRDSVYKEGWAVFPKIPKPVVFYTGIFAMQINIGIMPFLALTKMWTLGGIIITLNTLIYCWLGCAFLIGRAVEKGWTQKRITALKIAAILALLIIGFVLTTQLVLTDGIDDIRQAKAGIALIFGGVVIGLGVVSTVPRNREERHQIAPRLRKVIQIAIIVAVLLILFACYNWFKAAAN